MFRRTKYEIWVEILEICLNTPHHQSFILHSLGSKTELVKNALDYLLSRELISEMNTDEQKWVSYQTTLKGKQALSQFYDLITKFFSP